jgi:heme/copper-type cytochrome/quinol oxidase subunit 2
MNQSDLIFLVAFVILLTTLVVFVVQFMRSRRSRGEDGDGRAGWWEGPWDEDDRSR